MVEIVCSRLTDSYTSLMSKFIRIITLLIGSHFIAISTQDLLSGGLLLSHTPSEGVSWIAYPIFLLLFGATIAISSFIRPSYRYSRLLAVGLTIMPAYQFLGAFKILVAHAFLNLLFRGTPVVLTWFAMRWRMA